MIERLTHLHIYKIIPHGTDLLNDIKILLPGYVPDIIFDVGANIGQTTKQYLTGFPGSQIYCFEPVSTTFSELERNVISFVNVHCFKKALGSSKGWSNIYVAAESLFSSLNPIVNYSTTNTQIENVEIDTIDDFCSRQKIKKIGFLKIDTEGYDFEVLKGAQEMLSQQKIDFVQVEAGMNPNNKKFVAFEKFEIYLENRGFFLFGIYEQVPEIILGMPQLRRTNPVFISEQTIDRFKRT